ncbi:uncharacterized protein E(Pc) [Epargyreus clarus]|uniref:uncharacterized protein E(Pc) n=1 Tax=Epargyreus clarus TaxID=520877 RepID=UPI003C2DAF45
MSKLSFRARALDASKPMPIYLAEDLPDLPDYSAINRAVPQMPSGMEKEEESEHHLQRAISGTGLIIPTPEVCEVDDLQFYERCYPPDYKMPKQHIHMQPLWEEQEAPEYDIDSEDERWLKQQRHPELTELKFEQMMDKLERSSGQTVVTLNEAKLLLERHDDLVIAVYDYWLNKRLITQHPLVLAVKTESRPGQSTNNPYLAFRRRTEKMQTRKNRKNDESSYEKMLKLRRDLLRALTLLELVKRREKAKRDLVRLTLLLTDRRFLAGDFANQLLPELPPRPQYPAVTVAAATFRREPFAAQHYAPRAPAPPLDQPRQREKRPYKRKKHRHHTTGPTPSLRDSGVCTSSEDESTRTEGPPPDDGPFAFRRKPGCYYEMPTSTLCGDPVDPDSPSMDGLFEHELDNRYRYTLTSLNSPYPRCVGFVRRRLGRGGRVLLDRRATPLDELWPALPFHPPASSHTRALRDEEVELETRPHRTPKEMTRDYHSGGKYPWRHAFRRHLSKHPHLWVDVDADDVKLDISEVKMDVDDVKVDVDFKLVNDVRLDGGEFKLNADELKLTGTDSDVKLNITDINVKPLSLDTEDRADSGSGVLPNDMCSVQSDISVSVRTIDSVVRENLNSVMRKRSWSSCSDSSYDSDESLHPVEREFERFINEVQKKWLHFRPKTPPPSPPRDPTPSDDFFPVGADTPIAVELRLDPPSGVLDTFTTAEFTLGGLFADTIHPEVDNSGSSLDVSGEDLLGDNFGLTEAQVESILSDTDLKALDVDLNDKDDRRLAISEDMLEELVNTVEDKDSFLSQGQSADGRAGSGRRRRWGEPRGSSRVRVAAAPASPLYAPAAERGPPPPAPPPQRKRNDTPNTTTTTTTSGSSASASVNKQDGRPPPAPVPNSKIIVEEVNEVLRIDKKSQDTIEEVQLPHGVQLKTVQTKHSPLKKHIITSAAHRRAGDVTIVTSDATPPHIVTVAVSDSLKVRLQNQAAAAMGGAASGATSGAVVGLLQNGPLAAVLPHGHAQGKLNAGTATVASVSNVVTAGGTVVSAGSVANMASVANMVSVANVASVANATRRVGAPLVQLAPAALTHKPLQLHHHPVVVTPQLHHVPPSKLKVLHAHTLTHSQRAQLLAQNRQIAQLSSVVSLAAIGDTKPPTALLKTTPGSVAQFFEIKGGQLGKGPHLVNVLRQPPPVKATVARLDFNDAKKRQVVFDGTALKGNMAATTRPHRVSVSLDGRQIVRAAMPAVRAPHVRHQIQLKNRTVQVAAQIPRSSSDPSTSITIAPPKTASIPSSVVANLLQKNVQLPKGQKIAISGAGAQALSANVQAIAFTTAQLKARQGRLITQPRPTPVAEIVEASTAPVATSSNSTPLSASAESGGDDAAVRRRAADTLPMEVT